MYPNRKKNSPLALALAFCAATCAALAQTLSVRHFEQAWDTRTTSDQRSMPMSLYQGERVTLDLTARRGASPIDLTNAVVVWKILDWDLTGHYLAVTGEVADASAGIVRLALEPHHTGGLLPATYRAFVEAGQTEGTTTLSAGVLAAQQINLLPSALAVDYPAITPHSPYAALSNMIVQWACLPATCNIDLVGRELLNVAAITLGGDRRTVWPAGGGGTGGVSGVTSIQVGGTNVLTGEVDLARRITGGDIALATIGNEHLGNAIISSSQMAANSVAAGSIQAGAVAATKVTGSGDVGVSNHVFYARGLHRQEWAKPSDPSTIPVYSGTNVGWQALSSLGGGDMLKSQYVDPMTDEILVSIFSQGFWPKIGGSFGEYIILTNTGTAGQWVRKGGIGEMYFADAPGGGGGDGDMKAADFVASAGTGIVRRATHAATAATATNALRVGGVLWPALVSGRFLQATSATHMAWADIGELGFGDMTKAVYTTGAGDLVNGAMIQTNTIPASRIIDLPGSKLTGTIPNARLTNIVFRTDQHSGDVSGLYNALQVTGLRNVAIPVLTSGHHMHTLTYATNALGGEWLFTPSGYADTNFAAGFVLLSGSTMTGGLSNEAGFFGDGSGLTNLNVVTTESDPLFTNWLAGVNPGDWSAAYAWGNHAAAGYATGTPLYEIDLTPYATGTPLYVESDPEFTAWLAVANTQEWDTAYSWGDHSTNGYLTQATTGAVVSVNTLQGEIVLAGGTGVTITPAGNTLTFDAEGGAGVESLPTTLVPTNTTETHTYYIILAGASNWMQRIPSATNALVIDLPAKANTNVAAMISLTIDNPMGNPVSLVTNATVGFVPAIPTNAPSGWLLDNPEGLDLFQLRRRY